MKKKWNLILSMVAVVFTLAVFTFGVYAAVSPSFTISNNIKFDPSGLAFNIVGKVDGYDKTKTPVLENYVYNVDKTQPLESQNPPDWDDTALRGLTFVDKDTSITFTFEITSKISKKFSVSITGITENQKISYNLLIDGVECSLTNTLIFEADDEDETKTIALQVSVNPLNNLSFENESNNFTVVIAPVE